MSDSTTRTYLLGRETWDVTVTREEAGYYATCEQWIERRGDAMPLVVLGPHEDPEAAFKSAQLRTVQRYCPEARP